MRVLPNPQHIPYIWGDIADWLLENLERTKFKGLVESRAMRRKL